MIANANMIRALRSVTIERGRDPSEYRLCAFGGSGPVHAAHVARAMEIDEVIIPPCPGLFSAFGLLLADLERHYSQTVRLTLDAVAPREIETLFTELEARARDGAQDPEHPVTDYTLSRSIDLRYHGQVYALTLPVKGPIATPADMAGIAEAFGEEYRRTYGFDSPGESIEVNGLRVVIAAEASQAKGWFKAAAEADAAGPVSQTNRSAYFGPDFGWHETPIVTRAALRGEPRPGPFIIEGYDATTVVPPDFAGTVDEWGNIILKRTAQGVR
jgi:N-methylhydantoinase A